MRAIFRSATLACLVGALLAAQSRASAVQGPASPVTFAKDVAPIVFAHCSSCHRPGGSASFSLLTYADAKTHAVEKIRLFLAEPPIKFPKGHERRAAVLFHLRHPSFPAGKNIRERLLLCGRENVPFRRRCGGGQGSRSNQKYS